MLLEVAKLLSLSSNLPTEGEGHNSDNVSTSSLPTGKGSHANPGLHAIRAGDWIAKVDLKDALFHAPTLKTGQRVSQILVQRPNLPVRVHVPLGSSPRP